MCCERLTVSTLTGLQCVVCPIACVRRASVFFFPGFSRDFDCFDSENEWDGKVVLSLSFVPAPFRGGCFVEQVQTGTETPPEGVLDVLLISTGATTTRG